MRKRILKNMEWGILICTVILMIIGLVALFSATQNSNFDEFKKQIIWILVSIPVLIAILIVDYELLLKITPALYGIIILLLLGVLFTTPVNGATSWYNIGPVSFQPAEFAKIVIVLALSYTIVKIQSKGKNEINVFYKLGIILLVAMIPVMLIVKQPDYGTAMAFIMALIFMLFVAGIDKKYIIIAFAVVIVAVPLLYLFVLPEHAKTRIDVYLNPELDPRGAGYNICLLYTSPSPRDRG